MGHTKQNTKNTNNTYIIYCCTDYLFWFVFDRDDTVKKLWLKLHNDHPDLLSNYEHFLSKITNDISKTQKEVDTLEHALKR